MKGTKSLSHFDLSFEFLQSDLQRLTFPESTIMFNLLSSRIESHFIWKKNKKTLLSRKFLIQAVYDGLT